MIEFPKSATDTGDGVRKAMDGQQSGPEQAGVTGMVIVTGVVAMVLVQVGRIIGAESVFSDGLFLDADIYMWFLRVEALEEGRGWFEHLETRVNPPDGHIQHWTRPVDAILWAGAWVLAPLFGFRDGLALWGNLMSPLLLFVAAWVMYRMARQLIPHREAVVATAVFVLHPIILLSFAWGRPDHHSLLGLGQVLFLLGFLKFFIGDDHRRWWAFGTGWVGAWSIWANIEALGFVLIAMIVLGLWWLLKARDLSRCIAAFGGGLFGGTVAAVAIERGPYFFADFPIDTFGFPYVVLFGLTFLFWVGLALWSRYAGDWDGLGARMAVSGLMAALVLGALALWMPSFFAGPFGEVDELYRQTRLDFIGEQLPALRFGQDPPLAIFGRGLIFFGMVVVSLPFFVQQYRTEEEAARRWSWSLLGGMAVLYSLLALDTVRWIAYMPAAASVGFGVLAGRVFDIVERRREGWTRHFIRPVAVAALVIGFPTVGLAIEAVGEHREARAQAQDDGEEEEPVELEDRIFGSTSCDLRVAARRLEALPEVKPQSLVAIDPDRSSELLYRTDHTVLAMANHRPQPGFSVFVKAMSSPDLDQAHHRLSQRGVDLVMICESQIWPTLMRDGRAAIERLGGGERHPGFSVLATPDQAGGWRIYGVD